MFFRSFLILLPFFALGPDASAQEDTFDGEAFAQQVNAYLKAQEIVGVVLKDAVGSSVSPAIDYQWAQQLTSTPPQFGVVVLDENQHPVDVLGSDTPFIVDGKNIEVPGYALPQGGKFTTVGAAGWNKAVAEIVAQEIAAPNSDIQKAVSVVSGATDYIAAELCHKRSRPTKIVFHLTAGFELVFGAQTGSQIEWDLELVCPRMAE